MRFALHVALATAVVLAGCGAISGPPPSDDRALAVRNATADYVDTVDTYRFSTDTRVAASDGDRSRSVDAAGNGSVDRRRRVMVSRTTVEGETIRSAVRNRTAYTECQEPWDGWATEEMSDDVPWHAVTPLGRQLELLGRTNVYWDGTATVRGERAAVVVAYPSPRTLDDLAEERGGSAADVPTSNVENVTVRLFADPETGEPLRTELRVEVGAGDASGTAVVRTDYVDFGEPANATVPGSALTGERYELGCPGS